MDTDGIGPQFTNSQPGGVVLDALVGLVLVVRQAALFTIESARSLGLLGRPGLCAALGRNHGLLSDATIGAWHHLEQFDAYLCHGRTGP